MIQILMYSGFSKWLLRGVPWWLRFWVFAAMAWVQLLVGELKFQKPQSQEKEKITKYLSDELRFLDRKVPEI